MARAFADGYALWLVNDAYLLEPARGVATVLYACDRAWWKVHAPIAPRFPFMLTQDRGWLPGDTQMLGLTEFKSIDAPGLSERAPTIHAGMSSSFQLLNIAVLAGARDILLLGHDLGRVDGKAHFFGEHPPELRRDSPFAGMIRAYESSVKQLAQLGVSVTNGSPRSALRCFPFVEV